MKKREDLRITKTKNAIYNTFFEMMKEKSFEEIKIADICSKALINRSTFYAHFNDKYELLVAALNFIKDSLYNEFEKNPNSLNSKEYYMEMIKILLDHIEEKRDLYYGIMIKNRDSVFMDIILDVVNKDFKIRLEREKNFHSKIPPEFLISFYFGAVSNIGVLYLMTNKKYSEDEIYEYLDRLIPEDINKL